MRVADLRLLGAGAAEPAQRRPRRACSDDRRQHPGRRRGNRPRPGDQVDRGSRRPLGRAAAIHALARHADRRHRELVDDRAQEGKRQDGLHQRRRRHDRRARGLRVRQRRRGRALGPGPGARAARSQGRARRVFDEDGNQSDLRRDGLRFAHAGHAGRPGARAEIRRRLDGRRAGGQGRTRQSRRGAGQDRGILQADRRQGRQAFRQEPVRQPGVDRHRGQCAHPRPRRRAEPLRARLSPLRRDLPQGRRAGQSEIAGHRAAGQLRLPLHRALLSQNKAATEARRSRRRLSRRPSRRRRRRRRRSSPNR